MPVICDLYARVSTREQAENGHSIAEQKERLQKYAEAQGWTVNKLYSDEGFSGGSLNRAGIVGVIQDCEQHIVNKVVVFKLDRLSRSQKDTLHLIEDIFIPNEVSFVSMTESIDTGTAFGMAMIGVLSVFAQLERATIQERMSIGRKAAIKEGQFRGGSTVPFGYTYDTMTKRLSVNEPEAVVVRRIFAEYAAGKNLNQIRNGLLADFPNMKHFHRCTIERILSNPFYIGLQRWDGELFQVNNFPQFVPDETYEAVEELLSRRQAVQTPQSSRTPSCIMAGISYCAYCGRRIRFVKFEGRLRAICANNRERHNKYDRPHCQFRSFYIDDLQQAIIEEIKSLQFVDTSTPKTTADNSAAEAARRLSAIDSQISRLIDLYATGTMDAKLLTDKINDLNAAKKAIEEDLAANASPAGLTADAVRDYAAALQQAIDNGAEPKTLAPIVHSLIRSITLRDDNATIQWNF